MRFGVAMLANIFYPSIGGAQTHILRLGQKLRARNVDVIVVTRHHKGLAHYEEVGGVPTYRVGNGDRGKALASISYLADAVRLLHQQRRRIDILHAHQMVAPTTIGLLARPLVRAPLLINPHARGPIGDVAVMTQRRPVSGKIRLAMMRRWATGFVSISDDISAELQGVGMDAAKLWDIPNGVDLDLFRPATPEDRHALRAQYGLPDAPLVMFTGRLAHVKGLDVLLNAWKQTLEQVPAARLVLVGEGEERVALEQQARQLGIAEKIIFFGGTTEVATVLRTADVFVLCSRTEGLPVALLEAMATGLPVVATNVGGMAQILRDGKTARLVPVEDANALGRGLADALTLPDAATWGQNARAQVAAEFSLDTVAERHIAMYEALLRQHRPDWAARNQALS